MKTWFANRDEAGAARLDDELPGLRRLTPADRACCCPARPAVTVIMPAVPGRRHRADLLLCGHHYRVSRAALRAAGAMVYDEDGTLIADGAGESPSRREPAATAGARYLLLLSPGPVVPGWSSRAPHRSAGGPAIFLRHGRPSRARGGAG
jgi:hypothetical protein